MLSLLEQAFVGRDEKRGPLKTPAWEAINISDLYESCHFTYQPLGDQHVNRLSVNRSATKLVDRQ